MLDAREVVDLDIAYDDLPEKYYVEEEVSHYCHAVHQLVLLSGQHCSMVLQKRFLVKYNA